MSAANLDPHLLATLDPEERAAFDPDPEADAAALRAVAGDDSDDDTDDDEDDASEGGAPVEGKGAADPAPAAAPAAAPAPAADDTAPDPAPAPEKPIYQAALPQDYEAKLQGIKDEDARLRQAFKDGEIDIDERDAGLASLTEQREALLVARTKAEIAGEMNQQTAAQQWTATVNRSLAEFAKPENGGVDYRKDPELGQALDSAVKMLANNPANNDKSMDWFLTQAHKWVMFERGITPPKAAPADPKKAAADKRKPDTSTLPRTLADVPGADGPGDVASEFAALDTLDGEALEDAIARMSNAQREKFLRGE